MAQSKPRAVIALTRYAEPNALVLETLESLARLEGEGFTVHLADQRADPDLAQAVAALSTPRLPFLYDTIPAKSLSFARNHALNVADADIVLFIDPDAIVETDWALHLATALERSPEAALVGGRIVPLWRSPPPVLARARFVRDVFSVLDLGPGLRPYHRVVGASFGVHKRRLGTEARFDERLGRREGKLFSGEESELCARALAKGFEVLYEHAALAHHQIGAERARTAWILQRFYYAGMGRVAQGGEPRPSQGPKGLEWLAVAAVLPAYGAGYIRGLLARSRG
ncbi:MAG: glycosyltransferase [Pseudomonadota bacterium]